MTVEIQVLRDYNADLPEMAYRAFVRGPGIGLVDAAGPTPEHAKDKVRRRLLLRWLGVEWSGMATPDEALNPISGQAAINSYRFALWRQLHRHPRRLVHWIVLNPSTAGDAVEEATVRRVCDFSARWGFSWVTVGSLWPYRAHRLDALKKWLEEGGEWVGRMTADSDRWVARMAGRADLVVVAWGEHGCIDRRGRAMLWKLATQGIEAHALAVTATGEPVHPLDADETLRPRPLWELRLEKEHEGATAERTDSFEIRS